MSTLATGRRNTASLIAAIMAAVIGAALLTGCQKDQGMPTAPSAPLCVAGNGNGTLICIDGNGNVIYINPAPTPTPAASPSAESCRIDYMILQPRDGFTLAKDQAGRVSLTPYQTVLNPDGTVAQREVSEACNLPRIPAIIWSSSSAAVTVGTGFEPSVLRVGVGVATITATLEGRVSNSVVVR